MAQDADSQVVMYISGSASLPLLSLRDGEVVAEVPLGHTLIRGNSRDDMIATIGFSPCSVVIINDRHEHEQQLCIELSDMPVAVAISPAQDTVAVMLDTGVYDD